MKWRKQEVSVLVDTHGYIRAIAYGEPGGGKSLVGPLGTDQKMGIIYVSTAERIRLAEEIVRRCDTVALLKCEEVSDIRARALAGEFDESAKDLLDDR